MDGFELDVSHWPLVITHVRGTVTIAEVDAYFEEFEANVMTIDRPFASIFDASDLKNLPDAKTRARAAQWSRAPQTLGVRTNCGLAIVAPNPVARAVMKALHWVVPPRVPTSYEADFRSALRFVTHRLTESHVDTDDLERWIEREGL